MGGCLEFILKVAIGLLFCMFVLWMLPILLYVVIGYIFWLIGEWLYESLNEKLKD